MYPALVCSIAMVEQAQAETARTELLEDIDVGGGFTETGDAPYVEAETPDDADPQWCVAEFERTHKHTEADYLHIWQLGDDRFQVSHEDENGITWGCVYGASAMAAHVTELMS